jgi:hypothetical protein
VARHPGERVALWVFFTDKGVRSEAAYLRSLNAVRLNDRTVRRRAKMAERGRLAFDDIPVHAPYVEALRARGARIRHESRWLNAASAEIPADGVDGIAALPFVREIRPVMRARRIQPPDGDSGRFELESTLPTVAYVQNTNPSLAESLFYGPSYNQNDEIGVASVHREGYTGAGVLVCMLDTGYRKNHVAFLGQTLVAEKDFVFNDGNTQNQPADNPSQHNHGTGTWATLGGYAPGALVGHAFGSEFVLAKTEDVRSELPVEEDNYVAGLEWADTLGAEVASSSLGYLTFDDASGYTYAQLNGDFAVTTVAVDFASTKGIVVATAMGNSGPGAGTLITPADADTVIAVGAVDSLGAVSIFSSRGPTGDGRIKPEIATRGSKTMWATASDTLKFAAANGTSLAAPLAGGCAAILLEAHPTWTPYDVRNALMTTASHAGTPDNNTGRGLIRLSDALHSAPSSPPRKTLPFELVGPTRGSTAVPYPQFTWRSAVPAVPGDSITYEVRVADNKWFYNPLVWPAGSDTSLTAPDPLASGSWWWTVVATNEAGYRRESIERRPFTVTTTTGVADRPDASIRPALLTVAPAAPNPFGSGTVIRFALDPGTLGDAARFEAGRLEIFSADGRLVRSVEAPPSASGAVRWDATDREGSPVPAGVYFARLRFAELSRTQKLVVRR